MHKILIIDNNPEWNQFTKTTLEKHNYQVIIVENIEQIEKHTDTGKYDLILINSDIIMGPYREKIHHFFFQNLKKPIIIISMPSNNYEAVQKTRTAFKLGADDFVDKPLNKAKLIELVSQLLQEFGEQQDEVSLWG